MSRPGPLHSRMASEPKGLTMSLGKPAAEILDSTPFACGPMRCLSRTWTMPDHKPEKPQPPWTLDCLLNAHFIATRASSPSAFPMHRMQGWPTWTLSVQSYGMA